MGAMGLEKAYLMLESIRTRGLLSLPEAWFFGAEPLHTLEKEIGTHSMHPVQVLGEVGLRMRDRHRVVKILKITRPVAMKLSAANIVTAHGS
jgi:hypothetical protein